MTRYQWTVFLAAWLGWGFDVFDGLLFNFVAPVCVPRLLGVTASDPDGAARVTTVTGIVTSALLIGWGTGGVLFGRLTDRLGRARTLQLTIVTYAGATAACAFAPDIWTLMVLRFIASLGIGGEWAAGASLVAEVVPPARRVAAGALLYTSAPLGILLAGFVTDLMTKRIDVLAAQPDLAWRLVFLTGLVPAAFAIWIRRRVEEPEIWRRERTARPRLAELFVPGLRRATLGGLAMCLVTLVTWWATNAFLRLRRGASRRSGRGARRHRLAPLDGDGTLRLGRIPRHARHDSTRPSRPAPAVRDLPGRRGGLHLDHVRPGVGPLDAHAPALSQRAHRLRRGGGVQLLPAGALPHTAAWDGQRVLLQHGTISRGRRTVRRRLGARGRSDADGRHPVGGAGAARWTAAGAVHRRNAAGRRGARARLSDDVRRVTPRAATV
jgi:hypothetical protein